MSSKYRAVKGKLPKKAEIIDWPEAKLLALLAFARVFLEGEGYVVDSTRREAAETRSAEEPYWEEFLARINQPLGTKDATHQRFRIRLMTLIRVPLAWLKSNPFAVTEALQAQLESTPRFSWCLTTFVEKTTDIGGTIVAMQNRDTTDPSMPNYKRSVTDVDPPQIRFNKALLESVAIFEQLTKSIKPSDIRNLQTKEKLRYMTAMAATLTKTFREYKPNVTVFQQINVNKAERDELESAMYDYAETQDITQE